MAGLAEPGGLSVGETLPSWNTAPGQACALVRRQLGHEHAELVQLLWGLIPHWCRERPASRPINAVLETAGDKPTWRRVFKFRRCLIAADGWYEWRIEGETKVPYFLHFRDGRPFFFGGLWDTWRGPDGEVPTFAILTREPVGEIAEIHDRMPVIIQPEDYHQWLDKSVTERHAIEALCVPPSQGELEAYRVSTVVNKPDINGPELIARVPADALALRSSSASP